MLLEWKSSTGRRNSLCLVGAVRIIEHENHTIVRYSSGHNEAVPLPYNVVMQTIKGETHESNDRGNPAVH